MTTSKTFNRLLSVLLLVCMLVSFAPAAYAEGTEAPASVEEPAVAETAVAEAAAKPLPTAIVPGDGTVEPQAPSGSVKCNFYSNPPAEGLGEEKVLTNQTVTLGDLSFFAGKFAYDGYKQTGWNTARDGSGDAYALNGTITKAATLYAQWEVDESEPTFDKKPNQPTSALAGSARIWLYSKYNPTSSTSPESKDATVGLASNLSIGEVQGNDNEGYWCDITVTLAHGDKLEAALGSYLNSKNGTEENWTYNFEKTGTQITFTIYNLLGTNKWWGAKSAVSNASSTDLKSSCASNIKIYMDASELYTVTYTDGVADVEVFADQTYTVEKGTATPAFNGTPTRPGYEFAGWLPEVAETVTESVTYVAQWVKLPESVALNVSIDCACQRHDKGSYVCMSKVTVYVDGEEFGSLTAKGGHNSQSFTVPYGAEVKLVASPNTMNVKITTLFDGYYQNGELLSENQEYVLGQLKADADVTAKFVKAEEYLITFNGNGGYATGQAGVVESADAYVPGTQVVLAQALTTRNKFYKELSADYSTAYRQIGWSYEKDGEVVFAMDATITMPSENITLYAVWEEYEWYHWTFTAGEGGHITWGTSNNLHVVENSFKAYVGRYGDFLAGIYCPIKAVADVGYQFVGWYRNGELLKADDGLYTQDCRGLGKLTGSTQNTTIVAVFKLTEYIIPVDPANGEEPYELTLTYEDQIGANLNVPVREGYTFTGWVDQDGNPVDLNATYTENIEKLVGTWELNEYVVPVNPANGEEPYDVTFTYEDVIGDVVEEPVREGYTFTGWVDQDGNPVDLSATYTEAIEKLDGTWKPNEYVVPVNPANGEEPYDVTFTYENRIGDEMRVHVREGYTFTGWVDQDGNPVDLNATYTENIEKLVGTWKLTEYVVPVDPANGEDAVDVTYTYADVIGDKYDFETEPVRKGYTFEGWVDQDGNPVDLTATYTEDIESISASWKGKTYTVTFKLNEDEGTLSFTSKKVVNGDPLGYTPKVEREGYTFIGWYDANGKYYNSETIFDAAQDITLTGRWTKTVVPTGDENNAALFALVMLASMACAGATILRLRKGKEET